MNNEEFKTPDEIFQNLKDYEAPYSEAAWGDMASLLDKAGRKKPFLFWFQKNKNKTFTLITLTMITTTLISVLALMFSNTTENTTTDTKQVQIQKTPQGDMNSEKTTTHQSNLAEFSGSESSETLRNPIQQDGSTGVKTNISNAGSQESGQVTAAANSGDPEKGEPIKTPKKAALEESGDVKADVTAVVNNVEKALNTGNEEKKTNKDPEPATPLVNPKTVPAYTTFRGPWMGIHFTAQEPRTERLMDSNRQNYGFNWQFMSTNLMQRHDFGGHAGFDFGMQWYGRTKNYGVVLDNNELDSGFTRLSTHSFDLFVRGHFEYGRFRLKPYINGFAGPRIFATSQYTESYRHKVDYENSSNTNAYTTASLMFGAGIGARFALSKHVSLDFRYEMMQGTETRLVDLDRSVFNSLSSFQLSKFTVSPEYQQLKFGVLFDLWDGEETREYKPENNNEVVEVSEYYYFDSTTNQYLKVYCRCSETPVVNDSNDTKNNTFITPPDHYEISKPGSTPNRNKEFPINNSRFENSGGSGGGGKGSFPGIKSGGGGGIKIKS